MENEEKGTFVLCIRALVVPFVFTTVVHTFTNTVTTEFREKLREMVAHVLFLFPLYSCLLSPLHTYRDRREREVTLLRINLEEL